MHDMTKEITKINIEELDQKVDVFSKTVLTIAHQSVEQRANEADKVVASAANLEITDDATLADAADLLALATRLGKDFTTDGKLLLTPLKDLAANVKGVFDDAINPLTLATNAIKTDIVTFSEARDAVAATEAAEINAAVTSGKIDVQAAMGRLAELAPADKSISTVNGTVSIRNSPEKLRITDALAVFADRPDLLEDDDIIDAIRKRLMKDHKAGLNYPEGTELYRDKTVATKVA
jgi:hypothetical protein